VYVYIYMYMHVYTIGDAERHFIREGKLSRVRKRHESAAHYTFYVFDDALIYASEDMAQVCVCEREISRQKARVYACACLSVRLSIYVRWRVCACVSVPHVLRD